MLQIMIQQSQVKNKIKILNIPVITFGYFFLNQGKQKDTPITVLSVKRL
jgi:hypothetical protein